MTRFIIHILCSICFVWCILPVQDICAQETGPGQPSSVFDGDLNGILSGGTWVEFGKKDGITHFTAKAKASDLEAYKGVCVINCPIEILYAFLTDVSGHNVWIKYCSISREIERSQSNSSLQYYDFDIPWPFSNRDIVVHCESSENWKDGKVTITGRAINAPGIPVPENHSRITESYQNWILEKIDTEFTLVTFTSMIRLKGPASGFLSKLVSRTVPSESLINFRKISTETYLSERNRLYAGPPAKGSGNPLP